tara:strand:+ start:905 stop:1132 length:228 start_codon:yes stop_codon:yes gene_type:complete
MLKSSTNKTRVVCDVCGFLARHTEDIEKMKSDGCCVECYQNFRFIYGNSWTSGKRPSLEEARDKMLIFIERGKNG